MSEGASRGPRDGCRPWVMPHPRPSSPALTSPVDGGVYYPCRHLGRVAAALLTQAARRPLHAWTGLVAAQITGGTGGGGGPRRLQPRRHA